MQDNQRSVSRCSGVVNAHAPVASISGAKITLAGATNPFQKGDRALVLQTTGATIDTTDTERFGKITDDNGAGRYAWATVAGTTGQEVELSGVDLGGFDATSGKLQLVRALAHEGSLVIDGRVETPAWDGAAGGVIAIEATETIEIRAEVDASGKGFPGGKPSINAHKATETGYTCAATAGAGYKGAGIAEIGPEHSAGRGAPANGGGGGNHHNGGGGGGGNGGAGGRGGDEWSTSNSALVGVGGLGGGSLEYADRAFLGGGGGGGQQNDRTGSGGGSGGGIVILRAQSITGAANGAIRADGSDAPHANKDGGGGGGAGGTILLDADVVTGAFRVQAHGGRGANAAGGHGTGGGGGGGVIRMYPGVESTSTVTRSVLGGPPGSQGPNSRRATAGEDGILGRLVAPPRRPTKEEPQPPLPEDTAKSAGIAPDLRLPAEGSSGALPAVPANDVQAPGVISPAAAAAAARVTRAREIVRENAVWALGAGALLMPFLDILGVSAIQVKMLKELGDHYGVPFHEHGVKSLVSSLLGGIGSHAVGGILAMSLVKLVPFLGHAVAAAVLPVTASAITHAVGQVFIQHFEAGGTFLDLEPAAVREHFRKEIEAGKAMAANLSGAPNPPQR